MQRVAFGADTRRATVRGGADSAAGASRNNSARHRHAQSHATGSSSTILYALSLSLSLLSNQMRGGA